MAHGTKATRRRWWIAVLATVGMAAAAICMGSKLLKQVESPRAGRPLRDRVAIVYSSRYQIKMGGLEKLHSFDINKYEKIYLELVKQKLVRPEEVFVPEEVSQEDILRVHTPQFLTSLHDSKTVARYLEAPIVALLPSQSLDGVILTPFRYATGGTVLAARLARQYGIAINLGGGYHHAKPDGGEGFCVYADMPIAIRVLQSEKAVDKVLVVDLDVHQGNGTAVCFRGSKKVFTFSMHEDDIYPIPKARSDLDVPLPAGTDDQQFLAILGRYLPGLLEDFQPELVFLQAGCDTLAEDPLAHLAMTQEGIVQRDALVIDECVRREIPVVMVLGGGYSKNAWAVQYASIERTIRKYGLVPGTNVTQENEPNQ